MNLSKEGECHVTIQSSHCPIYSALYTSFDILIIKKDQEPCNYPIQKKKRLGWREYVRGQGWVIGVEDFGASGAYLDTCKKFGFTEENVTRVTKSLLCD